MSEVNDFLKAISQNPEAKKLFREAGEPADMAEAARLFAEIAEKTGISVSPEAIQEFLESKEKIQKEMTARAEGAVKVALDEDELDNVSGGADAECASTVNAGEWCWISDGCDYVFHHYEAEQYDVTRESSLCENMGTTYSFDDATDGWEDWDVKCKGLPDSLPDFGPDDD